MFCTHCGKEIEEGSKFCYYCGDEVNPEEELELPELKDVLELLEGEASAQSGSETTSQAAQQVYRTAAQDVVRPTYQSAGRAAVQTAYQSATQTATQSAYQPAAQTVAQPAYQPAAQPAPQSTVQPVYQSAPQTVQQPVYQSAPQYIPQNAVKPAAVVPAPSVIPASQAAQMASQAAVISSNAGVAASNAAVAASNAGVMAGNAAVVGSNAAVVGSNAAVVTSNTAVVAATGMSTAVKVLVALLCTAVIVACCAFFIPLNEYGDTLSDFILGNAYWDPDMNDVYHAVEGFEASFNERDFSAKLDYFPPSVSSYFRMYIGIADIVGGFFGLDGIFTEEMLGTAFGFALQDAYIDIEVVDISFNSSKTTAYVTVNFFADGEMMQETLNLMKISGGWYLSEEYFDMDELYPSFG